MPELPFNYPTNAVLIPFSSILIIDRGRRDLGDIDSLARAISSPSGLVQPPLVALLDKPTGNFTHMLVGGERRITAMRTLGAEVIPCSITTEQRDYVNSESELFENMHRKEMTWQEHSLTLYKAHRQRVAAAAKVQRNWMSEETGKMFRVKTAHVAHVILIAPYLEGDNFDQEITDCTSLYAAYQLLLKRKEETANKSQVKAMGIKHAKPAASSPRSNKPIVVGSLMGAVDELDTLFTDEADSLPIEATTFPFSKWFNVGNSVTETMPAMSDSCVDHIVTDPPYGIDVCDMKLKNVDTVVDTHDAEANIEQFLPFLTQSYRILKDCGYLVFWYDMRHHEKLLAHARSVGFVCQDWPIVWHKSHSCLNQSAQFNYTKDVEFAMVCRKGNAMMNKPQQTCVVKASGQAERALYDNPFAKPADVWNFILDAIAFKGQTIYDPFMGQGSCARAVLNSGMVPRGTEIDEKHYNHALVQLKTLLTDMVGGDVEIT